MMPGGTQHAATNKLKPTDHSITHKLKIRDVTKLAQSAAQTDSAGAAGGFFFVIKRDCF